MSPKGADRNILDSLISPYKSIILVEKVGEPLSLHWMPIKLGDWVSTPIRDNTHGVLPLREFIGGNERTC